MEKNDYFFLILDLGGMKVFAFKPRKLKTNVDKNKTNKTVLIEAICVFLCHNKKSRKRFADTGSLKEEKAKSTRRGREQKKNMETLIAAVIQKL